MKRILDRTQMRKQHSREKGTISKLWSYTNGRQAWPVWRSSLSIAPCTERSQVRFPVRTQKQKKKKEDISWEEILNKAERRRMSVGMRWDLNKNVRMGARLT